MSRLFQSRVNFLVACVAVFWLGVSSQEQFEDLLGSNTKLWRSFQDEMRTLEEAAHKVNTMLSSGHHQSEAEQDQEVKAAETPLDVTVLASPDKLKDGLLTETDSNSEPKEVKLQDKKDNSDTAIGGDKVSFNPQSLNFGSLIHSLGFFRNLPEPWWKGKNVCVEKSEKVEDKKTGMKEQNEHVLIMGTGTFEHCKQTSGKYICTTVISTPESTKTVSTTYQCCEGFRRQAEGCVQVKLKDVVKMVDSLGSKEFASALRDQDIMRSFTEKNITVFAPIDSAMKSFESKESNQIRERRVARAVEEQLTNGTNQLSRDMTLAHITDSLLDVDDFNNEMVINSLYQNTPLRINIYPGRQEPVMTVNCARMKSWDNVASHARVYTVDRVLEPVTRSVIEILAQPNFSQFRQYLEQQGLLEVLANTSAITVFAPNNEAWDKLGAGLKDKYSRSEACINRVLRHHLLPLTLCAAPVSEGRLSTTDLEGELVRLARDEAGQIMVDDKGRVVQEDIVATNGVVHVLDKVLTPKSAKPLSQLLSASNHSTWLTLLDRAGLMEQLDRQRNLTIFVPTERALADETTQALLEGMDTDTLRRVLLHHVTGQATPTCDLNHDTQLRTHAGTELRVTTYNPYALFSDMEPRAAVQCAPLGHTDGKACHVVAHEVTQLLLPPNSTALQFVAEHPQLSLLKQVFEGTQLEKDLKEKSEELADGFTMLAPTDDAFTKLDEEVTSKLLSDKKFADEVLRQHIIKENVCCASVSPVPWPFTNSVRTISDKKIEVNRDRRNRVLFGDSAAEKCDAIVSDGIIHTVDTVILPESSSTKLGSVTFGSPDRKIILFGI